MKTRPSWLAAAALFAACAGGQSGNEGDLSAAPCARDGALLEATVVSANDGCVELEVVREIKTGVEVWARSGAVLYSGHSDVGARLLGKLGQTYSYTMAFMPGDRVAVLPGAWSDMLEFQLLSSDGDLIRGRWGSEEFTVPYADIASPQCESILKERVGPQESSGAGTSVTPVTQAPPPIPNCVE